MQTVRDALHHGAARLQTAGIENPRLESRLLLAHALGTDVAALLRDQSRVASSPRYDSLLSRRIAREPIALIVGHREFWSLEFAVSPVTLIPRPNSETLVEAALASRAWESRVRVLDLGTGTGCLLLAVLSELPGAFGVGVDRCQAAVELAKRNAAMLGMNGRAAFVCGDWGNALNAGFDLVLCNPPYIATQQLDTLMPDVARYEPATALDGGPDGFAAYRSIIPDLGRMLTATGIAVLEVGHGQAEIVAGLARQAGFTTTTHPDLSGIPRAVVINRPLP